MRRSLRNRLALAFFAITFVAIVVLYVYVAPGLRSRLLSERLNELEAAAYASSVSDVDPTVSVVRRQILIAGGLALLLALVVGYLVARALTRRVKRLELAAEQVAGGNFEHPIPVDSADELGQLAVAFNQMQHQLAQLSSAREKFIATASHELRTPIFSLGGFIELLEDEELDDETRPRCLVQA